MVSPPVALFSACVSSAAFETTILIDRSSCARSACCDPLQCQKHEAASGGSGKPACCWMPCESRPGRGARHSVAFKQSLMPPETPRTAPDCAAPAVKVLLISDNPATDSDCRRPGTCLCVPRPGCGSPTQVRSTLARCPYDQTVIFPPHFDRRPGRASASHPRPGNSAQADLAHMSHSTRGLA